MKISGFIGANNHLLRQLSDVIQYLSADQYALFHEGVFESSIGGHVRHINDHYENFFLALYGQYPLSGEGNACVEGKTFVERPLVNYDSRERDRRVENDPVFALERITAIIANLDHMPRSDIELDIILQIDSAPESALQVSTVSRELSFLYSHTVHHLAIISYILRAEGKTDLPHNFGVAASTIVFRKAI